MRILHLDAGREMRGGQWQVLRLIEGLAAAGVESTLLAREDAPLYAAARKLGWRVQPLGITRAIGHLRSPQPDPRPRRARPLAGRVSARASAGGVAPRDLPRGFPLEVRKSAALSGRLGVRQEGADGWRRPGGKDQRSLRRRAHARSFARQAGAGSGKGLRTACQNGLEDGARTSRRRFPTRRSWSMSPTAKAWDPARCWPCRPRCR